MYLQRRRRLWYALHDIPRNVQAAIGKPRFVKSLGTESKQEAQRRATVLEHQWRTEIELARRAKGDQAVADWEALQWRQAWRAAKTDEVREHLRDHIADLARDRADRAASKLGYVDEREAGYDDVSGVIEAERFADVALGNLVRTNEHLEDFLATLSGAVGEKTIDMRRTTIRRFSTKFPSLADVVGKDVQQWADGLVAAGRARATVQRALSDVRGYWDYLKRIEVVPQDRKPLDGLRIKKASAKFVAANKRPAFAPPDVVRLYRAAQAKCDQPLADLIWLAMWTGARIEELCALPVAKVGNGSLSIEDAKTLAGWRNIPIHPRLAAEVERMVQESKDGHLLSGLSLNKYGDRSNAIGKRFGHLKTRLGFPRNLVFHSIRHTVATILDDAGVGQNVIAAILGHERPGFTLKTYSAAELAKLKCDAIRLIDYPPEVGQ